MAVLRFVVAVCILGVITLEGLNTAASLEAQKNATELVTHLGTRFSLDPKIIKTITDNLPYLKFLALSALGALVIRFHAFLIALYVILTRAEGVCKHWTPVQKALQAKPSADTVGSHREDLTYILTFVGVVAYLLSFCCSSCGSAKACAHATEEKKGTHNVHK